MRSAPFPHDLIQLQHAWNRTYEELAVPSRGGDMTTLRRRLHRLSTRIVRHPHFDTAPGGRAAARVELRRLVRAYERRGHWGP